MPVAKYLKKKQKKIQTKYHQVAKRFESKYELIHRNLTSRFHREKNETELIRSKINNLITQPPESINRKIQSKKIISIFSKTSSQKNDKFYPDIIDWIQGRFSGKAIRIIVREGKIIEKVFLTPKGNRISVKRSKLGLLFSSMPIMTIKLRLRYSSMTNNQPHLGFISIKRV